MSKAPTYTVDGPVKTNVWVYDSIESSLNGFPSIEEHKRLWHAFSPSFYGTGATFEKCREYCQFGNSALVEEANKLLDRYQVNPATLKTRRQDWLFGQVPNVPRYLNNSPYSMRRRIVTTDNTAPLNIYVGTDTSARISEDDIKRRGIAILALVIRLSEIRPVSLCLFTEASNTRGENMFGVFKVQTQPLEIATACHALTSPNWTRGVALLLDLANGTPRTGPWPRDRGNLENYRKYLNLEASDLLITGAHIDEFRNVDQWFNQQLAKYSTIEE